MTTNQEKIRYLKQYQTTIMEIERRKQDVNMWRDMLQKVTASYSSGLKGGGTIRNRTEELIAKIVDLERHLHEKLARQISLQHEIEQLVENVGDSRERLLLQYRYLDGMTFEEIAVKLNLSWRWVHTLHSRALDNININ
jgi:DNA-directed RNA polymerase specialized sigma subunit